MLQWIKLHPCQVIALGVAFTCTAFVAEREVSGQAASLPLGWVAVLLAAGVSFCCGISFQKARHLPSPPSLEA